MAPVSEWREEMLCNGFKMEKSIPKAPKLWGSLQPDASVHLSISGVWVKILGGMFRKRFILPNRSYSYGRWSMCACHLVKLIHSRSEKLHFYLTQRVCRYMQHNIRTRTIIMASKNNRPINVYLCSDKCKVYNVLTLVITTKFTALSISRWRARSRVYMNSDLNFPLLYFKYSSW